MSKHVLVINDTQAILELLRVILEEEAGYHATIHSYSTRDLPTVKEVRPDLIISDHVPTDETNGWQFLQKLKMDRETEHIPLIICTTMPHLVAQNEGWLLEKGIVVVAKPFTIDELLAAVRQQLGEDSGGAD
jgi:DNA-binding response OmpR family regulator